MFKLWTRFTGLFARRQPSCVGCEADRMRDAINELAQTVYSDHPMAALTCWEATALARVLAIGGHLDKAADLLVGHSYHDDEAGDEHNLDHLDGNARKAELREHAEFLAKW